MSGQLNQYLEDIVATAGYSCVMHLTMRLYSRVKFTKRITVHTAINKLAGLSTEEESLCCRQRDSLPSSQNSTKVVTIR